VTKRQGNDARLQCIKPADSLSFSFFIRLSETFANLLVRQNAWLQKAKLRSRVRAAAKRKTINRGTKRRLRILALRFQNPAFHTKTRDNLHQSSSATAAPSAKWPRTNRHLSECKSGRLAKKAKTPLFGMNNLWGELHAHPLGFALHQDCHHFSLSRQCLVIALSETDIKNLPQIAYFSSIKIVCIYLSKAS
jgi:hypothetical protein